MEITNIFAHGEKRKKNKLKQQSASLSATILL